MNTIRKMKRSTKALSPVVASIILIAVTVAVSIAVAAWMGALVVGNMATEEAKITNVDFSVAGQATITIKNTGSQTIIVSEAYIGSTDVTSASDIPLTGLSLAANAQGDVIISQTFTAGQSYQFKLVTTKGNPFVYTATAPL